MKKKATRKLKKKEKNLEKGNHFHSMWYELSRCTCRHIVLTRNHSVQSFCILLFVNILFFVCV